MFKDYDVKIFAKTYDHKVIEQIETMLGTGIFDNKKVRIMPDTHVGVGCVIGFTGEIEDKIDPNIVGVDLGCGVNVTKIDKTIELNYHDIDEFIRNCIPNGNGIYTKVENEIKDKVMSMLSNLKCFDKIDNIDRIVKSFGTLGGGNHFIEIAVDEDNYKYLVIHTGSRNLGVQIAKHYYNIMINGNVDKMKEKMIKEINKTVDKLKKEDNYSMISSELEKIKAKYNKIALKSKYITGDDFNDYLHDIAIAQKYAVGNRHAIANKIISEFKLSEYVLEQFESIHNYIDIESKIVRKGAISAKKGERVVIPINMATGSIIGIGKGNEDWNYSAPHGAGRIMSRTEAKETINMIEYIKSMKDVYTTSVNNHTIDEAPMAYRGLDEIQNSIVDTVDIVNIIKPVYNFKSNG